MVKNLLLKYEGYKLPPTSQIVIASALGFILFALIYFFFPITNDYYLYYRPVAENWLSGNPSMQGNEGAILRYPPWTLLFIVIPMGLPPTVILGNALLTFCSMLLIAGSVHILVSMYPAPKSSIIFAIFNLFMIEMLFMGQIDSVSLFGIMIGWWAIKKRSPWVLAISFCLLGMKPFNLIPLGFIFLIGMRTWRLIDILKAFSLPVLMVVVTTLYVGFDFFTVYLFELGGSISDISIILWDGLAYFGLPAAPFVVLGIVAMAAAFVTAWREGLTQRVYALVICTTFVFTPYSHADYYILMIPAFIYVWRLNWRIAMLAYAVSFLPILRIFIGREFSWISVLFPIVLLLAVWLLPSWKSRAALQQERNRLVEA
jgi:hypothetical protein